MNNFYILLTFLLITILLRYYLPYDVIVSIYCYRTKNQSKQKDVLTYHETGGK